jgi:hypothetical protein
MGLNTYLGSVASFETRLLENLKIVHKEGDHEMDKVCSLL